MSINPKLVNSAISPVQRSETECKTVKSECKMVKLKMTDSSDKIKLRTNKVADKNEKIETVDLIKF